MEEEKISFVKKCIEEGNDRHAARRALVSAGYGTDDFNTLYDTALAQLGISEPKGEMPDLRTLGESAVYRNNPHGTGIPRFMHNIKVALVLTILFALVVVGGYMLISYLSMPKISDAPIEWGKPSTRVKEEETLGFSDSVLQTKVKATVASAMIQGGRMGGYEGVCKDITIVAPVSCRQTQSGFVIYAPMSDGTYYCEDKAENGAIVSKKPLGGESCK
jgi:hypothetical protein